MNSETLDLALDTVKPSSGPHGALWRHSAHLDYDGNAVQILCITPLEPALLDRLAALGPTTYLPDCDVDDFRSAAAQCRADIVFTNPNRQSFMLDAQSLPASVRVICTASTGVNHIDLGHCAEQQVGILAITRQDDLLPKISSTAEHALALMLALIRQVPRAMASVRRGEWDWTPYVGRQLDQLSIGILGYGRLGKIMARFTEALGMNVALSDPYVFPDHNTQTLGALFERSDVVSLHVPVTPETAAMIDAELLGRAQNMYLINTSRSDVVDESAVISALTTGHLAGYATDVLSTEFGRPDDVDLRKRMDDLNIIVTPHIAGMTSDARAMAFGRAIDLLGDWLVKQRDNPSP